MGKNEDFSKVIKVVAELMEVREEDIYGRTRTFDAVDARWMVISLMREKGYSTQQIVPLIRHPERTVNHALSQFDDRVKYSLNGLGNTLAIARQQLRE